MPEPGSGRLPADPVSPTGAAVGAGSERLEKTSIPALANFIGHVIIRAASPMLSLTHASSSDRKGFEVPSRLVIQPGTSVSMPNWPRTAWSWSSNTLACSATPPATPYSFESSSLWSRLETACVERCGRLMSNSSFHLLLKVLTTRIRSVLMATPHRPPRVLASPVAVLPACRSGAVRTSSRSCRSSLRRGCRARRMWLSMSARLSVADASRKSRRARVSSRPTRCTRGSPMCRTTPSTDSFCSSVSWKELSCRAVTGSRFWIMRLMLPKPAPATARTMCLSSDVRESCPTAISWSVATSASSPLSSSVRAVKCVGASLGGGFHASTGCSTCSPGGGMLMTA
mmetsp:Transcript_86192/g.257291  ORF Transcript_86192/g.257291 Transcript_86192/m.257291 type:complete len:342 (-) Transcript_86192:286-1311(-)